MDIAISESQGLTLPNPETESVRFRPEKAMAIAIGLKSCTNLWNFIMANRGIDTNHSESELFLPPTSAVEVIELVPSVCVCVSALMTEPLDLWTQYSVAVFLDPSWQKDFGAKELYNTGRRRCVNAQAFSLVVFCTL